MIRRTRSAATVRPRPRAPSWERGWPGREIRSPRFIDPWWLVFSAISASLEHARDRYIRRRVEILDVGCGPMPYYPLFSSVADDYAGADPGAWPRVRHRCPAEQLDVADETVDLVLCTQVLEHVRDPHQALREMARVLRVGGFVFLTTHGVWPFHPTPNDYWRWTQQGLEALIEDTPRLKLRELVPHRGTAAFVALMVNTYLEILLNKAGLRGLGSPAFTLMNGLGLIGDRVTARFRYPKDYTLITNFLIVAERVADVDEPQARPTRTEDGRS